MALILCSQCQQMKPAGPSYSWEGGNVCGLRCLHDAGDRTICKRTDYPDFVCGCTGYAKKRRSLREHRVNMRVMDQVIQQNGLEEELDDELEEVTGNTNFWLGLDDVMDEDSDAEDPERALVEENRELRRAAQDQKGFLEAVQGALECRALMTDVERARMQLEDMRGLR
jgi:hypothetical protein